LTGYDRHLIASSVFKHIRDDQDKRYYQNDNERRAPIVVTITLTNTTFSPDGENIFSTEHRVEYLLRSTGAAQTLTHNRSF
jgi:hypothetical protein